jgi:hypothetical protein
MLHDPTKDFGTTSQRGTEIFSPTMKTTNGYYPESVGRFSIRWAVLQFKAAPKGSSVFSVSENRRWILWMQI